MIARPELQRLFDEVISSADARLQKPDPAMFRLAETRLGAGGSEVVYLDDMAVHVDAALALGWRAILYRSTDQAITDLGAAFAAVGDPAV